MPDHETFIQWLVFYAAGGFGTFTLMFGYRAWKRTGRPRRPLHGRWLVTMLFGAWAARMIDLVFSRAVDGDLNAPRTVLYWLVLDVAVTWLALRWASGRLVLGDPPRRGPAGPAGPMGIVGETGAQGAQGPQGETGRAGTMYDRRSGGDRRRASLSPARPSD